jgi:hypothetical protein
MLIHRNPLTPEEKAEAAAQAHIWQSNKAVTMKTLDVVIKAMVKKYAELEKAVEARLEMLEDAQLKYQGVFTKDQQYNHNDLCTHRGGLWICKSATRSAPGTSSDWQLTHKTIAARGQKA